MVDVSWIWCKNKVLLSTINVSYTLRAHFVCANPPLCSAPPVTWRACWRPALARWCRGQSSDWPRGRFISARQKDETIWINVCSCQTPDQPTWDQRSTTRPKGHRALGPTWPDTHLENESLDLPTSYVARNLKFVVYFLLETKHHPEL